MSKLTSALQYTFRTAAAVVSALVDGTPAHGVSAAEGAVLVVTAHGKDFLKAAFGTTAAGISWLITGAPDHGILAAEGIKTTVVARKKNKTPKA